MIIKEILILLAKVAVFIFAFGFILSIVLSLFMAYKDYKEWAMIYDRNVENLKGDPRIKDIEEFNEETDVIKNKRIFKHFNLDIIIQAAQLLVMAPLLLYLIIYDSSFGQSTKKLYLRIINFTIITVYSVIVIFNIFLYYEISKILGVLLFSYFILGIAECFDYLTKAPKN